MNASPLQALFAPPDSDALFLPPVTITITIAISIVLVLVLEFVLVLLLLLLLVSLFRCPRCSSRLCTYTQSPLQDSRLFGPRLWKVLAATTEKNDF